MLRCPKCSRIYQDGTQRFCTHDGGRLLPVSEPLRSANPVTTAHSSIERNQTGELSFETREKKPRQVISTYKFVPFEDTVSIEVDDAPLVQNAPNQPSGKLVKPVENSVDKIDKSSSGEMLVRPSGRLPLVKSNVNSFIGQNIKGRYSLEKVFSQDSTSVTYLAKDRVHAERRVMLKILLFDKADAQFNRRFYEEKVALSHVNHPSIGGVLDAGELPEGKPFVVMEFVEGQSLREILQKNGKLSATQTARIVRQVAQALTEAHNNRILHRDLKPENIYLKPLESGGEQVKVVNFGIGSEIDVRENNATLANLENFVYQSPEQLESKAPSPESDIFALGVIAYEMLTAQKPFGGLSAKNLLESQRRGIKVLPTDLRQDLQKDVNDVLSRALAYNPSQRFHLAREFGENFHAALIENDAPETSQNGASTAKPDEKTFAENVSSLTPFQTVSDLNYQAVQNRGESVADSTVTAQAQTEKSPDAATLSQKSASQTTRPHNAKTIAVNLPLIIGGVAFVAFLLLGYATYKVLNYMNADNVVVQETPQNAETPIAQTAKSNSNIATVTNSGQTVSSETTEQTQTVIPPNYVRFRSSREEANGKLAEKFVGFSIAYPSKWQKTEQRETENAGNFLNIANRISAKDPLEELFVTWYESKGTFEADQPSFPNYAPKLINAYGFNDKTKQGFPNLRKISESAIKFNGRDAYEVKLEGKGFDNKGKNMKIWVRTVFLPTEREGANSGLVLTMVATSLAPALSNVNDVGTKGELSLILETLRLEN